MSKSATSFFSFLGDKVLFSGVGGGGSSLTRQDCEYKVSGCVKTERIIVMQMWIRIPKQNGSITNTHIDYSDCDPVFHLNYTLY